jgi:N-acetylmuramoyl-L-alanine amidase
LPAYFQPILIAARRTLRPGGFGVGVALAFGILVAQVQAEDPSAPLRAHPRRPVPSVSPEVIFAMPGAPAEAPASIVRVSGPAPIAELTPHVPAPVAFERGGIAYTAAAAWLAHYDFQAEALDPDSRQRFMPLGLVSADTALILADEKREISFRGLRIDLGEPVVLRAGVLHLAVVDVERHLAPLLRPLQVPARPLRTLVIDAGHGGRDAGTTNAKLKLQEKIYTLDVARRLESLLASDGWRIVQTRVDDRFISLADRAALANQAQADLLVSIHFNAVADAPSVRGTETYLLTPLGQRSTTSEQRSADDHETAPGHGHELQSAVLGLEVHRAVLAALGSQDRGLKRARFAVLRAVDCPAVLIEAGYLSNAAEAARIDTEDYRAALADALAVAIRRYAATVGRGP